MRYSFFSDAFPKWTTWVAIVFTLLSILFCAWGCQISNDKADNFFVSLFAGLAGIFISFVIGLVIIDALVKHYEKRRWSKVRNITYRAITAHLCDLIQVMIIHFGLDTGDVDLMSSITAGRESQNPDTITGMAKLVEQLRGLPNAVSSEKTVSDIAVEYYEEVQWDFNQIRDVLTPRVIQSSDEQKIIDALIEFDDARRILHNSIIVEKQLSMNQVLPDIIGLVEKAQKLYSELIKD